MTKKNWILSYTEYESEYGWIPSMQDLLVFRLTTDKQIQAVKELVKFFSMYDNNPNSPERYQYFDWRTRWFVRKMPDISDVHLREVPATKKWKSFPTMFGYDRTSAKSMFAQRFLHYYRGYNVKYYIKKYFRDKAVEI